MRVKIGAVIAVVALLCAGCDWTQFAGGANHSNAIYDEGLTTATIGSLVSSTFANVTTTAQVVTSNGLVYAQRDGALTAYDAIDVGRRVERRRFPPARRVAARRPSTRDRTPCSSSWPARSNLLLVGYDGAGARNCNALTHTCNPIFLATLGSSPGPATPPAIDGGKVFVNGPGALYAFDAAGQSNCGAWLGMQACSPLWVSPTGTTVVGSARRSTTRSSTTRSPTASALGAFDEATGNTLWTGPVDGSAVTASASISSNGTVFVPGGQRHRRVRRDPVAARRRARRHTRSRARVLGDAAGQSSSRLPRTDGATVVATNAQRLRVRRGRRSVAVRRPACRKRPPPANTPGAGSAGRTRSRLP